MYNYKSDITQFLDKYWEDHPEERENRLKHRMKLWDVKLNQDELEQFKEGELPKKGYSYYLNKK